MAYSPTLKILLTGATGYIGGSVLAQLMESTTSALQAFTVTCLIRGEDRANVLTAAYGARVQPIVYKDLDDTDAAEKAASEHDIVINTTTAYHIPSSQALLRGLAKRRAQTGRDVWLIHTSGTGNLADRPISGIYRDEDAGENGLEFNDATSDVHGYEVRREAAQPFPQRTAELAVIKTGLELGVKTLVVACPLIFGAGTGKFNIRSIQIPAYIHLALMNGQGLVVGAGKGVWDHVHIQDLTELYEIVVTHVIQDGGKDLPTGEKGIIFCGNGRHSWQEVAQGVVDALHRKDKLKTTALKSVELADMAKSFQPIFPGADENLVEIGLSSNSRTISTIGKKLGWHPSRGEEAWKSSFDEDVRLALGDSE